MDFIRDDLGDGDETEVKTELLAVKLRYNDADAGQRRVKLTIGRTKF